MEEADFFFALLANLRFSTPIKSRAHGKGEFKLEGDETWQRKDESLVMFIAPGDIIPNPVKYCGLKIMDFKHGVFPYMLD